VTHQDWPPAWTAHELRPRHTAILRANYLAPEGVRFYDRSLELYQDLAAELDFNVMSRCRRR
jgi:hypothetical protein